MPGHRIKWNDWHVIKEGTVIVKQLPVVGVSHYNSDGDSRQEILAGLERWTEVDIVPEQDNQYDEYALAVMSEMGQIGYISKNDNEYISELMKAGYRPLAKISNIFGGGPEKNFGCTLELHLIPSENATPSTKNKTAKFVAKIVGMTGNNEEGNSRKDIALYGLNVGDNVWLELNDDEFDEADIAVIVCTSGGEDFGRLGKKDARIIAPILEQGEEAKAYVSFVGTADDNDERPAVEVTIFLHK